jgi:Lipocalin-like domain
MRSTRAIGRGLRVVFVTMAFGVLFAGSCDDEANMNGPGSDALLGSWVSTSLMAGGMELNTNGLTLTITFESDGTYTTSFANDLDMLFCEGATSCTDGGPYTRTGTQITLDAGTTDESVVGYSISGDTMTVTGDIDGTPIVFVFHRA